MKSRVCIAFLALLAALALLPSAARAATYQVGPSRQYKDINAVAGLLKPGDVVEVDGDATYPSVIFRQSGSVENPITIRGIRKNGKRPVISGGTNTVEFRLSNYNVFEGFEVTGGTNRGLYHHAAFITVRDVFVHDCPGQGITGSDQDSGSLLLEYSEVARCGGGMYAHPIYMSTDPHKYPNSVFRMQFCWIHDGGGGNAVKSRSERNEIYYNCIESGFYRELELIGRDREEAPRPMNSDVVGNVFLKKSQYPVVRIGHDSHGSGTRGRYRFVNNTFILSPESSVAIQVFGKLESVEMHNNVFFRMGGGPVTVLSEDDAEWTTGKRVCSGLDNWVTKGSKYPEEWNGTLTGDIPGFADLASGDLRPSKGSTLVGAGTSSPVSAKGFELPNPLFPPAFEPAIHQVAPVGSPRARTAGGAIDIGAFEFAPGASERGAKEASSPRVPPGFRGAPGTLPEPYTDTGWAKEVIHEKTGIEMLFIPAGEFEMGSPASEAGEAGRYEDESPVHRVKITKPFYLGKYEVTQSQWRKVMGSDPSHFKGDRNPVEQISWEDCRVFLKNAGDGLRLPTEAEWEYACRAGTRTAYSFGDDRGALGRYVWYEGNSGGTTHQVGTKQANPWGLYDMHGNICEWCRDWYDSEYYRQDVSEDPHGPSSGRQRVVRGGSAGDNPEYCRAAKRDCASPNNRFLIGMRVAKTIE